MTVSFAVFDVDHTITRASTGRRLMQHGYRAGLFPVWSLLSLPYHYFRYRTGTIRMDRVAEKIVGLAGCPRDELEHVAARCYAEHVRADIMEETVELVVGHQHQGDTVVLASSSLAIIVRPLAHDLGIDHVICTELEYVDGVATGAFRYPPCFGHEKLRRVRDFAEDRAAGLSDVVFYSDSRLDLPLLRASGRAVAVNPDRGLRRVATREGWPVISVR